MATMLGGIALSDNLIIKGLIGEDETAVSSRRTITGRLLYRVDSRPKGRTLTLIGKNHFRRGQLAALKPVKDQGLPVTLSHRLGTFTVLIVALPEESQIEFCDPDANIMMSGEIKLLEV